MAAPFEPGVGFFPDIPADGYHESAGVSVSRLKIQADCAAKTWVEKEETAAMARGTVTHTAIFEPHLLEASYLVSKVKVWNDDHKAFQAEKAEAKAQGRTLCKPADMEKALRMRDAMMAHPIGREAMAPGLICEAAAFWIDEETGLLCRGKADGIRPEWAAIIDAKTTTNASPRDFAKTIARMRYHWQDAMYRDGFSVVLPWTVENFLFFAIEDKPPFVVQPYELTKADVQAGRDQVRDQLRRHKQYREAGIWPAYSDAILTVELPFWANAA